MDGTGDHEGVGAIQEKRAGPQVEPVFQEHHVFANEQGEGTSGAVCSPAHYAAERCTASNFFRQPILQNAEAGLRCDGAGKVYSTAQYV